jgi:hypothetical protein
MAALDVFETQAIEFVVTDIKLGPGEPARIAPVLAEATRARACG